jgi:hypothetical protein
MSDGFTVDPETLAAHGARVGEYAGHLRRAAGVARPLDTHAFGLVGQLFAGEAIEAAAVSSAAVGALSDTADEYARDLAGCVADYLLAERRIAALFEVAP